MAAPPEKTIRDLNGRWLLVCGRIYPYDIKLTCTVQNKSLSGNSERLMALQRVPWIIRKAICLADITIRIKQEGSGRSTTIILENTANFNVKGTVEARKLDWEMTPHEDYIWGRVQGRSKFMPSTQIPSDLLTAGNDEDVILSEVNAINGSWDSQMVCLLPQVAFKTLTLF